MTRYVALAAPITISMEETVTISSTEATTTIPVIKEDTPWVSMEETVTIPSTEATATTVCREVTERMSSMAGMATMLLLASLMGSGTSSIAVKAGTNTSLARTTMWTAVARRRSRPNGLIPYDIGE